MNYELLGNIRQDVDIKPILKNSDGSQNRRSFSMERLTIYKKRVSLGYSITFSHPSGASRRPIWIPVSVSYNFFVTGPISVIPLGKQISLP